MKIRNLVFTYRKFFNFDYNIDKLKKIINNIFFDV